MSCSLCSGINFHYLAGSTAHYHRILQSLGCKESAPVVGSSDWFFEEELSLLMVWTEVAGIFTSFLNALLSLLNNFHPLLSVLITNDFFILLESELAVWPRVVKTGDISNARRHQYHRLTPDICKLAYLINLYKDYL
jgi:hypothetical protein